MKDFKVEITHELGNEKCRGSYCFLKNRKSMPCRRNSTYRERSTTVVWSDQWKVSCGLLVSAPAHWELRSHRSQPQHRKSAEHLLGHRLIAGDWAGTNLRDKLPGPSSGWGNTLMSFSFRTPLRSWGDDKKKVLLHEKADGGKVTILKYTESISFH